MAYHGKMDFCCITLVLAFALSATSAQAATVTLSGVIDGNGSPLLFDPAANVQSGTFGEIITLGLNNFTAEVHSLAPPPFATAIDTLFMTITAPTGFAINLITYTEAGTGDTVDGFASATGSMVVDGTPVNFLTQNFGPLTSSGWSILPTALVIANKSSIDISITNSLVAFVFAGSGTPDAEIHKTSDGSILTVGLTAIPLPPALLLMGTAIVALAAVKRREVKAKT